jgi:hypothetical protein
MLQAAGNTYRYTYTKHVAVDPHASRMMRELQADCSLNARFCLVSLLWGSGMKGKKVIHFLSGVKSIFTSDVFALIFIDRQKVPSYVSLSPVLPWLLSFSCSIRDNVADVEGYCSRIRVWMIASLSCRFTGIMLVRFTRVLGNRGR